MFFVVVRSEPQTAVLAQFPVFAFSWISPDHLKRKLKVRLLAVRVFVFFVVVRLEPQTAVLAQFPVFAISWI